MACPHISGLAALILSAYPDDPIDVVKARIATSADGYPQTPAVPLGSGRANAHHALYIQPQPCLKVISTELIEIEGNGNKIIEYGERAHLIVTVENVWETAYSVTATLTTENQYIPSITVDSYNFGSISSGQTGSNADRPFEFEVGPVLYETPVNFSLNIEADGIVQTVDLEVSLGIRKIAENVSWTRTGLSTVGGIAHRASGNKVVWSNNIITGNFDIYLYDLKTDHITQLTNDPGSQYSPSISGNSVVWISIITDGSGDDHFYDVYHYDLETGISRRIVSGTNQKSDLNICGDKIVWKENYGSDENRIFLYDMETEQIEQITTESAHLPAAPDVSETHVVWYDLRNGGWDIYAYDLATGEERRITNSLNVHSLVLSGSRIVYLEANKIYLYDLRTDVRRQIAASGAPITPCFSGDYVVWNDGGLKSGVYLYDLIREKKWRITTKQRGVRCPVISGRNIFWHNMTNMSVYMAVAGEVPNRPPSYLPISDQTLTVGRISGFIFEAVDPDYDDLSHSGYLAGDLNHDGECTYGDFPLFEAAFNSGKGDASFNPEADLDNNGFVDFGDFAFFAPSIGKGFPVGVSIFNHSDNRGSLMWTPTSDQVGKHLFTFVVADSAGLKDAHTTRVDVIDVPSESVGYIRGIPANSRGTKFRGHEIPKTRKGARRSYH